MKNLSRIEFEELSGGVIVAWVYPVIPGLTDRLPVPLSPVVWPFSYEKTKEVVEKIPALQGFPPYTTDSYIIGRGS